MKTLGIEEIKIVPEFASVPEAQLQWLISQGETIEIEQGELLFNIGEPVNTTYIILSGKMRICIMQSGVQKELRSLDPGFVTGYLPYSRGTVTPAFCEALKKSWIFKCSSQKIKEGITQNYELIEALVHMMISRVREFTSIQQQNEKMFSLGKLAAGLAHELNNPAAAIARAAALLQSQVKQLPHLFKEVSGLHIKAEKVERIDELIIDKINTEPAQLNMLQKAALEDELTDWLYDNSIENTDTEGLTERGFTIENLDTIKGCSSPEELPVVLEWISNFLVTNKMADDIRISSERISELVGAVKNFTFMDKDSDRQMVDVHSGIRNTLTMLNYKLKKTNVSVIDHFDDTTPNIRALPGELNQVWTNIIDNAIDAMEVNGKGNLTITSKHDERFVKVYIKDDGPGIPEELRERIFAPFFTTKEMGKGSGLGLDLVNRIMLHHNGTVKVQSAPGATEFEVCLPV